MDVPDGLILLLLVLLVAGWALAFVVLRRGRHRVARLVSRQRSQSTRYGMFVEQFAPWMKDWPFEDARGFRFLGDPVDGVHFADDAVYLVEVKSAGARLSERQRAIREAVLAGRVGWVTFRVGEKGGADVARPWERRR